MGPYPCCDLSRGRFLPLSSPSSPLSFQPRRWSLHGAVLPPVHLNRGSLVVLPPDQAGKGARVPHLRATPGQDFHLRSCRSRVSGFKACAYSPLARFPRATLRRPRRIAWVAASDRKRGLLRCWRQRDYSLNPRSHVACTIRCTTRSVAVDWLGRREPHHAVRVLALGWRSPKARCSPCCR
jgi:hypothetical protein